VKGILVLAATVVAAIVFASTASASSLTCAHGASCQPGNQGGGPTASGNVPSSSGTLPFTGLDLAGVAAVAASLLIGGVTLQRASRRHR
jgi:hypothetical protein